jgi:WD40 repeat protein
MSFGGWEVGATVRVLTGHTDAVWSVVPVTAPAGDVVLWSSSSDRTVRRWDPRSGQIGQPIAIREGFPPSLGLFTDRHGKRLILLLAGKETPDGTGGLIPVVHFFDADTAVEVRPPLTVVPGPTGEPCPLRLPDGRVLIATRVGDDVQLFDLDAGTGVGPVLTLPGRFDVPVALEEMTVAGKQTLMVCSSSAVVGLYDVAAVLAGSWTGPQTTLTGLQAAGAVAVPLPNGRTGLAVGGEWRRPDGDPDTRENRLHMLDVPTLQPLRPHVLLPASIRSVARLPLHGGGNLIAVSDDDHGAVRLFDPVTLEQVGRALESVNFIPWELSPFPLPDGRFALATAGFRDDIRIWEPDFPPATFVELVGHEGAVHALAAARLADGRVVVASGGADRTVRLWDAVLAAPMGPPLTGHTGQVLGAASAELPDGPVFVTAGDTTLRRWDAATGAPVGTPLTGHTGLVRAVATAALPDGRRLILSTSSDGTLRRWDAATGQPVGQPLTGHAGAVLAVTALTLPDGRVLAATGGDDGTVRLWDAVTGATVGGVLAQLAGAVHGLAGVTAADGRKLLAAGDADGTVQLWNAATGAPVGAPLTGHTGGVRAVTELPRGGGPPLLVSASDDATVRFWNPDTGATARPPLTGHTDVVRAAVALPALADGRVLLATAGADARVLLWTMT